MIRAVSLTLSSILIFALPGLSRSTGEKLEIKSLIANAKGQGLLVVGGDELKITSVVVNLKEGGAAEINLTTDTQILIQAKWSENNTANQIDLRITGGVVGGGAEGSGKLILRNDAKSIDSLSMEGKIRTGSRFKVTFQADKKAEDSNGN